MYPFERFTEEAKKALTLAQEEAERSHHSYIGTEHMLLGIMRLDHGSGQQALVDLGISQDTVRETIKSVLGRDERILFQQIIPTSRVKKVIELAFEESQRMGSGSVSSGHILIGIVVEGEGIAAHVLQDLGAGPEQVIAAVERALGVAPSPREIRIPPARRKFSFRPRTQVGSAYMIAGMKPEVPSGSDAETLLRLLRQPHIANLLRATGLADVEGLAAKLEAPPPDIIKLRLQLQDLRNELNVALVHQTFEDAGRIQKQQLALLDKLNRAEQEWIRKLTE